MAQQLFDAQAVTTAATIATAWTVPSTAWHLFLSDHAKQHAWIRNRWVIFIAPLMAILAFVALLVAAKYLEYSVNPLMALAFFIGHVGGAFNSRAVYKAQESGPLANVPVVGGFFQAGPLNHPADAVQASVPVPPPPMTSDETPPPETPPATPPPPPPRPPPPPPPPPH